MLKSRSRFDENYDTFHERNMDRLPDRHPPHLSASKSTVSIAIVGSRAVPMPATRAFVFSLVATFPENIGVVSGGAVGVDKEAERAARFYRRPLDVILPDWKTYGRSAGFRRNTTIVERSTFVIAVWNGVSNGTQDTVHKARQRNKIACVIDTRNKEAMTPRDMIPTRNQWTPVGDLHDVHVFVAGTKIIVEHAWGEDYVDLEKLRLWAWNCDVIDPKPKVTRWDVVKLLEEKGIVVP